MCFLVPASSLGLPRSDTNCIVLVQTLDTGPWLSYVLETVWIAHLFFDIRLLLHQLITLYYDNLSTKFMASNLVFHARTKHFELGYLFVCEWVVSGPCIVRFVPSIDHTADIFHQSVVQTLLSAFMVQTCAFMTAKFEGEC